MTPEDPEHRFRAAERRLRTLLFGDGQYTVGIAKGEESRQKLTRELRALREAFDDALAGGSDERVERAEARVADLEGELRRIAAAASRKAARTDQ